MRIGLIRMRYTPYGGAETFLGRFITELIKRGHSIDIFARVWHDVRGIAVHRVEASGPSFLRPLIFAMRAEKAVEKVNPDIVVSFERTFCQDIYRAGDGCHKEWLRRRSEVLSPLKRLSIKVSPLHKVLLYLEKKLFTSPRLKAVVANSNRVKADIIRHYGLPEKKIYVIYNGIDAKSVPYSEWERKRLRKELGIKETDIVLLFVGSGFERKGLKFLIRALGQFKDRNDIKLLVVGKGKQKNYLEEARDSGVSDKVIFTGPVKGALAFYQAGDVFVLPSIYEPFSNACLEAMAAGLPVVTSRVNGASEILSDGVNGAIVEHPADPKELAGKIAPFLDKDLRAKAGGLAKKEVLKHTIEKNVTAFLDVIEKVNKKAE